ncbi:GGDEF domain-containing protein [Nioella nitratireducens]|uniref:GGDEF domain-containing protein n=1 Tax=Nioella nitratireducens TaxID=1287720 RepID=UPI0008FD2A53|nr:GGDEF domain-containing protein [Nioella nitratireducens]
MIPDRVIGLPGTALDQVMPMHLWFGASGLINRAGPTLGKIARDDLRRRPLFDVLDIKRPRIAATIPALLSLQGVRLSICLRARPDLPLRGMVVALPAGTGGLVNLSLGLSFAKAVADCGLTLKDFSPCDQTVDLLYLREANAAIAHESRLLTGRLQTARAAAEEQALTDTLTGLANRRAMDSALKSLTDAPMPRFGLMHLDLDFFKEVNDSLGHAAGDHVLTHVADVLRSEIRLGDVVARVGGDEFVLLFRDCDDPDLLQAIGARLISRLEEPTIFDGQPCRISASAGSVLASRYDRPDPDRMLNDADIALYASKNRGRAQHTLFEEDLLALPPNRARPN